MENTNEQNKGKVGFSAKIFIFNKEGKILTIRRTETAPSNPLYWDLPGGDVEFGENPTVSIIREVKEEVGLDVKSPLIFDLTSSINKEGVHWITLAYKASNPEGELQISWEHDLHQWVTLDEFLDLKIDHRMKQFALTLKDSV